MKNSVFNGENGVNINYVFQEAKTPSDVLVVSFPGAGGRVPGGEWGYLVTISQFNVNSLFIRSDQELSQSRLTYINGKPVIENAVKALIDKCAAQVNASRIITAGSSIGGFDALYYGLKYGYDVIAGSPEYMFTDSAQIVYAVGKAGKSATDWLNEQIRSEIQGAGKKGFNKKVFISYGEGERFWLSEDHGRKLIKDLENANIKFVLKLYPYSNHLSLHRMFPNLLKSRLNFYLGLKDEPLDEEIDLLSPEERLFNTLIETYTPLGKILSDLPNNIKPFTDVKNPAHYGNLNLTTALRNFVYIEQGWYWGGGFKEPLKMPDKNAFWRVLPRSRVAEGLCFWFQDTLLYYYEQEGEIKALEWCAENARQYLKYICRIAEQKHNENWLNSLRRMHFFIALHKDLVEKGMSDEWHKDIPDEIRRDLGFFVTADINLNEPQGQYRRTLGLLHAAVYFKECTEFYNAFYNTAVTILNEITDFYFDENGMCIFVQIRDHCILAEKLMQNIKFIEENDFSETKELRTLKRKFEKIVELASHVTSPDGILAAIGHSIYEEATWTEEWIERKTGNYILANSNIAFLNDKNNLSYITVNGGSNVRSDFRHCDLLSFTWWYDNIQIFTDSEGGRDSLAEFAVSAMAHNGVIVDDLNYVTPSYDDFTTFEDVDEREDYVILTMAHNCYNGVTLKRRLIWIKPNIIVLYDEAESDSEHRYTQNFVMQNWNVDKNDKSRVIVSVAPKFTATISQIVADDNDYVLEMFHGTTNVNDETNYRGSLISGWTKLRKGCNLAYSKYGNVVKFLTVIELHSASTSIAEYENYVSSAKVEFDKLAVVLKNGAEICENGLNELRHRISGNPN